MLNVQRRIFECCPNNGGYREAKKVNLKSSLVGLSSTFYKPILSIENRCGG